MPLAVRPGSIEQGIDLLRELGVEGANVTMPHKQAVVPFLERLEGDAERLLAVNTIVRDGDALIGHNTDGPGFLSATGAEASFDPAGKRTVILGAGGAARAVAVALATAGASVVVSARRPEQAADLSRLAPGIGTARWGDPLSGDLIVNATPSHDGLPLATLGFGPGVLAVDLIYLPPATEFLLAARAVGAQALDGLGMLVHQAALSFRLWTGRDAPIDVMRTAAMEALAA